MLDKHSKSSRLRSAAFVMYLTDFKICPDKIKSLRPTKGRKQHFRGTTQIQSKPLLLYSNNGLCRRGLAGAPGRTKRLHRRRLTADDLHSLPGTYSAIFPFIALQEYHRKTGLSRGKTKFLNVSCFFAAKAAAFVYNKLKYKRL